MSYTTIIKQDGTTSQDTATNFTDGRIWKLASGESLRISGDVKIFKMSDDGVKLNESIDLGLALPNYCTMAINREEDKVYIIRRSLTTLVLAISDLSLISASAREIPTIKPLRAIIDQTGEKIVWMGDNNTLYKMDLDGGNLESLFLGLVVSSFCLDGNNNAYCLGNALAIVNNNFEITMLSVDPYHERIGIDSFALDGYAYFITTVGGAIEIIKFNTTDNTYTIKNLDITYGVSDIAQFNASGADNFGTFFGEKDGVMRRWQVNLDTLECIPYRWVTYPTKQVASNDTNLSLVNYAGVNGNNCDTAGLITSSKGVTGSI